MANLPETSAFDSGVYQIETTDLVLGGVAGPANSAAKNLANRTRWLFDQNTTNVANIAALASHATTVDGEITSLFSSIASVNANLASINGQLPLLAPLASPPFSGAPTAPTPATGDNSAKIATTAFVKAQGYATTSFVNPGGSLVTNGYQKFPGGLVLQWGACNPAGGGVTVGYNLSWPNSVLALVALSVAGGAVQTWLTSINSSNFTLHNTGGTSYWMAVGF